MTERHTGTLKFWNIERGFGFAEREDGGADVFVGPQQGMKLSFVITEDRAGRPRADEIRFEGAVAAAGRAFKHQPVRQ
jgi:cold shock CspA family protein